MKIKNLLKNLEGRQKIKLLFMGTGGISKAANHCALNYSRLSRILNGWVNPTEQEMEALELYLKTQAKEMK